MHRAVTGVSEYQGPFYGRVIFHGAAVPYAVYLSTFDGHLGSFSILAVMSNAAMNMHVHVFLWMLFSTLLGWKLLF